MAARKVGLVGLWDTVAFDEVAGINFKDHDGVQIMKDYMASGSFSRGRESINANASMVFIGNINQSVESLVKTSHLLAPFPEAMIDSAFFDRFHAYVPGWEIPKMRPEFFTNQYGLIVDYLAEYLREMRKQSFAKPAFVLRSQVGFFAAVVAVRFKNPLLRVAKMNMRNRFWNVRQFDAEHFYF